MKRPARCGWLALLALLAAGAPVRAQPGSELRFCIRADPKTFNPLLVDDDASETVRYLTGGVLVRLNRETQQLQAELATSWHVSRDGRAIRFELRPNLRFSDGTPFTAADVAYTVERLMDPQLHSPTGDAFRSGSGKVTTEIAGDYAIRVVFPAPLVGLAKLFDQVAMLSARSPLGERAVLGPYAVADVKPGTYVLLRRNPHYWKRDSAGRPLPYIEAIRLEIQQNRDIEMLRLMRGEIDLINSLSAEGYDRLGAQAPGMRSDAGVSLDSEQIWFNQVPTAPLAAYKRAWFVSTNFRRAISEAIDRQDLARVVYRGHARPAVSWISPANKFWFDAKLGPHPFDRGDALRRLGEDGFRLQNGVLRDRFGKAVEFSVITNAGNPAREGMAAMIQQDLAAIGIKLNVVTLDFPSLIDRIVRSFNYEACLLGLVNSDLDPNSQMTVWLSSGSNHQWNPNQQSPATAWEAELDGLMRAQAAALDANKRKQLIDRAQEIVWQQEPFIYLVNPDALAAVSPRLHNVDPVALRPQAYWNIDYLWLSMGEAKNR
ncbi:MAG: ABC transporter substrate-binding protein [Acidobacteriota bacterium]